MVGAQLPMLHCAACVLLVIAASACAAPTCEKNPTNPFGQLDAPCGSTAVREGDELRYPRVLRSSGGVLDVTMHARVARVDAGAFSFNARLFCVDDECTAPGPTLQFQPGDTVRVRLVNDLGDDVEGDGPNTFRHPNSSNVHTHGLHVDPSVDNVFLTVPPHGGELVYSYEIPRDHMAGLHWYHSHVHGATALHVMGGMVGAMVVEPSADQWNRYPPSYKEMPEHVLVLKHISLCSCNAASVGFRIISYVDLASDIQDAVPLEADGWQESGLTDVYLTNGQLQPQLTVAPGEWHRFEVLNAVGDTYLELEVRTAVGGGEAACEMMVFAIDGVFLENGPRDVSFFSLSIAGRVSLGIRCAHSGTYYLQSNPQNRASGYDAAFIQNLLTLQVTGRERPMPKPAWGRHAFPRPYYLNSLLDTESDAEWEIGLSQAGVKGATFWLGVGTGCADNGNCVYNAFAGAEEEKRHVGRLCDVEEVAVTGFGTTGHPIHIHVNHFQIVDADKGSPYLENYGEIGDWRDTLPALSGTTRFRYVLDAFGGSVVLHCRTNRDYLVHEDLGMMSSFWVDDSSPRCTATASSKGDEYCTVVPPVAYDPSYPSVTTTVPCRLDEGGSTTANSISGDALLVGEGHETSAVMPKAIREGGFWPLNVLGQWDVASVEERGGEMYSGVGALQATPLLILIVVAALIS